MASSLLPSFEASTVRFIKKLLILAVLLVGGVWLYGRSLPREHRASSAITLVAHQDTVFALIRNLGTANSWWSDLRGVRRLTRARESWEQDMGASGKISLEVTAADPPRRMITTVLNDQQQDFGGTWTYDVRMFASVTEVQITENGWIESPFFRVVAKLRGHHRTLNSYLSSLGAHFGESVTPRRIN